jgi:hypothetical protein
MEEASQPLSDPLASPETHDQFDPPKPAAPSPGPVQDSCMGWLLSYPGRKLWFDVLIFIIWLVWIIIGAAASLGLNDCSFKIDAKNAQREQQRNAACKSGAVVGHVLWVAFAFAT